MTKNFIGEINGKEYSSAEEYYKALSNLKDGELQSASCSIKIDEGECAMHDETKGYKHSCECDNGIISISNPFNSVFDEDADWCKYFWDKINVMPSYKTNDNSTYYYLDDELNTPNNEDGQTNEYDAIDTLNFDYDKLNEELDRAIQETENPNEKHYYDFDELNKKFLWLSQEEYDGTDEDDKMLDKLNELLDKKYQEFKVKDENGEFDHVLAVTVLKRIEILLGETVAQLKETNDKISKESIYFEKYKELVKKEKELYGQVIHGVDKTTELQRKVEKLYSESYHYELYRQYYDTLKKYIEERYDGVII